VSKKDTKELWKILNQFNNKNNKENQNDISLQTLFEHFKKPNENDSDDDVEPDFNLIRSSMVFFMYSFNIPSFLKALPFFYLSTTFFISFSVIGLFRN
jgi:hypothetical protein